MLPIQLIIEGLYSYQSKQTIDFTTLTQSGLFGIFGGVGSGKSSILEAISLALYGETERLNSRDSRGYNMLNLKSDKVYIEFDFTNFEDRKFKFTVSWKRKKKFEETTPMERLAYEWLNDQWIPMESADATLVLGLNYENFRRTIIIPQGKFKEFLELKGADRSKMMKEIFNLERFDLSPQVSNLQRDNNSKIEHLRGVLSGFETITPEEVLQLEADLAQAKQQLMLLKKDFTVVESEWKTLQEAQFKLEELRKKELEYAELLQTKPVIDQLQKDISEFETVERVFKELIHRKLSLEIEEQQQLKSQQNVLSEKLRLQQELEVYNQQLLKWQVAYEQLDLQKQKVSDFTALLSLRELESRLTEQKIALEKGMIFINEQQQLETKVKKQIQEKEEELEVQKPKRIDASQWMAIGNWYQHQTYLNNQVAVLESKLASNTTTCTTIINEIQSYKVTPTNWNEVYTVKNKSLADKITVQNQLITNCSVAVELSRYSSNLHEGEACPLCGSLEHPQINHQEDVSEQLDTAKQLKVKLEEEQNTLQLEQVKLQKLVSNYEFIIEQQRQFDEERKNIAQQQAAHLKSFIWMDFDPENPKLFESKKESAKVLEETLKTIEEEIKKLRTTFTEIQELTQKGLRRISAIEVEVSGLVGQINQVKSQIKILDLSNYEKLSSDDITKDKNHLEVENELVEKSYRTALDKIQELTPQLATKMGILETVESQLLYIRNTQMELDKTIANALDQQKLVSVTEVQMILSKKWDIEQEKQRITQFQFQLQRTKEIIDELQLQTATLKYDQNQFELKEQQYRQLQLDLEQAIGKLSSSEQELTRVQKALEEKGELVKQANALEQRALNLTTMTNLFKASGFVNYVSSIYLQNLCDVANVRFHRLTRNQLSLKLNENNEFEVLDYLNNGYARSVKTLSGGQGFQASLCLALALAESIQAQNKADKNFFFIDEGFGTQDSESINIVFETLQYLHKENRVVGIISHVEELQERIPSSISIFKTEEKGSFVVSGN